MVLDRLKSLVTLKPITDESKAMYLVRPEHASGRLIYVHPDKSIPRGAKLTVRTDECALFFREGQFVVRINAGTELLDTNNIPYLGHLLVDRFTGGNHFLCELYFVSLNETVLNLPQTALGQYRDLNSANVVSIEGSLSYTVKIQDPLKLISQVVGQSADAGEGVQELINGRMLNFMRKAVGLRVQRYPVLTVVSNIDSEAMSQEIQTLAEAEFGPLGLYFGRMLDLQTNLDSESLDLLRDFGKQESNLALQEKGSRIASQEGFAEFNLIQGQRAALEGFGQGMAQGGSSMLMTGGLGMDLTRRGPSSGASRPGLASGGGRWSPVLSGPPSFLILTDRGSTGPYSARQVALMAISKGQALANLQIRGAADPDDVSFTADLEPLIVQEYQRRKPPTAP
jgi:membrane protease subunit (stomatin/prohibitin family)